MSSSSSTAVDDPEKASGKQKQAVKDSGEREEQPKKTGHNKYRRDKPWDSEDIDHWKIEVRTWISASIPSCG